MPDDPRGNPLIPPTFRQYTIAMLTKGPNWYPLNPDVPEDVPLLHGHLAYMKSLYDSGRVVTYGPVLDSPDGVRAMSIYDLPADEVRALLADDPRVKAGHFIVHTLAWRTDSRSFADRSGS